MCENRSWINANPNSGLVVKYEAGDDGAIHRLEPVFMLYRGGYPSPSASHVCGFVQSAWN